VRAFSVGQPAYMTDFYLSLIGAKKEQLVKKDTRTRHRRQRKREKKRGQAPETSRARPLPRATWRLRGRRRSGTVGLRPASVGPSGASVPPAVAARTT
jgi:hypothetical protein